MTDAEEIERLRVLVRAQREAMVSLIDALYMATNPGDGSQGGKMRLSLRDIKAKLLELPAP